MLYFYCNSLRTLANQYKFRSVFNGQIKSTVHSLSLDLVFGFISVNFVGIDLSVSLDVSTLEGGRNRWVLETSGRILLIRCKDIGSLKSHSLINIWLLTSNWTNLHNIDIEITTIELEQNCTQICYLEINFEM